MVGLCICLFLPSSSSSLVVFCLQPESVAGANLLDQRPPKTRRSPGAPVAPLIFMFTTPRVSLRRQDIPLLLAAGVDRQRCWETLELISESRDVSLYSMKRSESLRQACI